MAINGNYVQSFTSAHMPKFNGNSTLAHYNFANAQSTQHFPKATAPKITAPKITAPTGAATGAVAAGAAHAPQTVATVKPTGAGIMAQIKDKFSQIYQYAKKQVTKGLEYLKNKTGINAETVKNKSKDLTKSAKGLWSKLKTSIQKNPRKWGVGAAVTALALLVMSSIKGNAND